MRFSTMSDEQILQELARRIDLKRREKELSDNELVERSGTNIGTVSRFRANKGSISLTSFLRLLRGLDELDALGALLEPSGYSPLQAMQKPPKKRIRKKSTIKADGFKWGDEE